MEIEVRDQQVSVFMQGNWTIEGVGTTEYGILYWDRGMRTDSDLITFSGFKMVYSKIIICILTNLTKLMYTI